MVIFVVIITGIQEMGILASQIAHKKYSKQQITI